MSNSSAPFRLSPPAFTPGQLVYNRCDGRRGIVIKIVYTAKSVTYGIAWGHETYNENFDFELTTEKPLDGVDDCE